MDSDNKQKKKNTAAIKSKATQLDLLHVFKKNLNNNQDTNDITEQDEEVQYEKYISLKNCFLSVFTLK